MQKLEEDREEASAMRKVWMRSVDVLINKQNGGG
jgi:hypothetical protein